MKLVKIINIISTFVIWNASAKPSRKIVLSWTDIVSCPNYDNKYSDMSTIKVYMANETTFQLKGTLDIKIDLDWPTQVKVVVNKDLGSGNFMTVLSYEADLCEKLDRSDKDWNAYINSLVPVPSECPVTKNKYDVSNVQPQSTEYELPKDMIGKYKSTIKIFHADKSSGVPGMQEMWCCYELNFNVELSEQ